jgi:hypothetical protein
VAIATVGSAPGGAGRADRLPPSLCHGAKGVVQIRGRAHKVWNCPARGGANPAQCLRAATLGIDTNLVAVDLNQSRDCVAGIGTQGVKGGCRLPRGENRRVDPHACEVVFVR